jgi:hypothetical protein
MKVDFVIDSTGVFTTLEKVSLPVHTAASMIGHGAEHSSASVDKP